MSKTTISIDGLKFRVNGELTHPGTRCEGLLMNTRMVQATFDDLNPETRDNWRMPDGSAFDAEANTEWFCAMLPTYKAHGIDAVTLNMQGGSPRGYSKHQPWHNSAYVADGTIRDDYRRRTGRCLDAADEAGVAVILGLFYFGQDERLDGEAAVLKAVDETVDWLMERGDRHVMVEIANESDIGRHDFPGNFHYEHEVLRPEPRGGELIRRVQERSGGQLLCSTSYSGGGRLTPSVAAAADFILLHGNAVESSDELLKMIADSRAVDGYRGQPIVINEDDHFAFGPDDPDNRLLAAVDDGVGWGYFDYRMDGPPPEPFEAGFQSVPTDWSIDHPRKRAFFDALKAIT